MKRFFVKYTRPMSSSADLQLVAAVEKRDVVGVRAAIGAGADPNIKCRINNNGGESHIFLHAVRFDAPDVAHTLAVLGSRVDVDTAFEHYVSEVVMGGCVSAANRLKMLSAAKLAGVRFSELETVVHMLEKAVYFDQPDTLDFFLAEFDALHQTDRYQLMHMVLESDASEAVVDRLFREPKTGFDLSDCAVMDEFLAFQQGVQSIIVNDLHFKEFLNDWELMWILRTKTVLSPRGEWRLGKAVRRAICRLVGEMVREVVVEK